jgi:hypothetical protein
MKTLTLSLFAALLSPVALASDVNVSVRSGKQTTITVVPGATVNYSVNAELSDGANEGLAFVVFDLEFDGGALSQAATPSSNPMLNFASPLGINNPAGFGGTVQGGKLIQVGGAQNTWNNTFAPQPTGSVIPDVGQPGTPVTVVSGSLTAPNKVGTYTLKVTNLEANVIKLGETGSPIWKTEAAGNGTISSLTVKVSALASNKTTMSISAAGSTATLSLTAGAANANRSYLMLGSFSGTSPGIFVNVGIKLPLNFDSYMNALLSGPQTILLNHVGVLNAAGAGTATFVMPTNMRPSTIGLTVSHAYLLTPTNDFASDAVSFTLLP